MVNYQEIIGILISLGSTILVMAVMGAAAFWFVMNKKFNIDCVIFSKVNNGYVRVLDKAGFVKDPKTKEMHLKLKKHKVSLNADNVPYLLNSTGGGKTLFLYQNGIRSFSFIVPNVKEQGAEMTVMEEDISWAVREYNKNVSLFGQSGLDKMMPFMVWGLIVVGSIVMLSLLLKKFDVLADVAENLRMASVELAKANAAGGGTIIQ
jgi:hypothetical protein